MGRRGIGARAGAAPPQFWCVCVCFVTRACGNLRRVSAARKLDELHRLAAAQHRIVSRQQLLDCGYSASTIRAWLANGQLHRVFDGNYVVGAPELAPAEFANACLLHTPGPCGLAGITGAEARGLLVPSSGVVHVAATDPPKMRTRASPLVVVDAQRRRHRAQLQLHPIDKASLVEGDWPLTTVPRMLVDAAGHAEAWQLRRLWREAEFRGLLNPDAIEAELGARQAPGVRAVRELLSGSFPVVFEGEEMRSRKEVAMVRLLAACGLPRPEFNIRLLVAGREFVPDGLWVDLGLAFEVDGGQHELPGRVEADKARDIELFVHAGLDVRRFTISRIEQHLAWCCAMLVGAYQRQAARAEPGLRARIDALRI